MHVVIAIGYDKFLALCLYLYLYVPNDSSFIGGYDESTGASLYFFDYLAAFAKVDFGAQVGYFSIVKTL